MISYLAICEQNSFDVLWVYKMVAAPLLQIIFNDRCRRTTDCCLPRKTIARLETNNKVWCFISIRTFVKFFTVVDFLDYRFTSCRVFQFFQFFRDLSFYLVRFAAFANCSFPFSARKIQVDAGKSQRISCGVAPINILKQWVAFFIARSMFQCHQTVFNEPRI